MSPYSHLFRVLHRPGSPDQRETILSIFLSSNSQRHQQLIRYPNDHSQHQQQQQCHPKTSSHPWNPHLFSASSRLENGKRELGEERLGISGFYHDSLAPSTIELRISDHHHRQQSHFVSSTAATSNILLKRRFPYRPAIAILKPFIDTSLSFTAT